MRFLKKRYMWFCFGAVASLVVCLLNGVNNVTRGQRQFDLVSPISRVYGGNVMNLAKYNLSGLSLATRDSRETSSTSQQTNLACVPHQNIVCIKVHKAASTTAAAILERYGWRNNKTLAVGPDRKNGPHILSSALQFKRTMVTQYQRTYNMLTNHVRYNRAEMNVVVPNATYMTILRHPVNHFESAFAYFHVAHVVNQSYEKDPIAGFLADPEYYFNLKFNFWFQLKSGQIFDLGINHKNHTGENVALAIQTFDKEFDLVMIADYFDESLLLLKRHLCLDWNDIVYIPDNFRAPDKKRQIVKEIREKIELWNWADMALYQHFNRTFWQKISDYGHEFKQDLKYFRQLLNDTKKRCTTDKIGKKPGDAHGAQRFILRENASEFCKDLLLGDVEYTSMFRQRQNRTLYNLPKNW